MATATQPEQQQQQSNNQQQSPQQPPPLWPNNLKIEIIGLTGEYESGKTLFGLTIDPPRTLVFDTEKSSGTYEGLGFTRVDLSKLSHLKPVELFQRWHDGIRNIAANTYRVIFLDTVSEIESGLADWVYENPAAFGHTKAQYDKMEGLYWGDVKEHWKRILSDIASRCETFVFASHLRQTWKGNQPTGKKAPKGKETLMELASLYLWLDRSPDDKGRKPDKPTARVLKNRLAIAVYDPATGDTVTKPILPPHLPEATPKAIRDYILKPADYSKLKKGELLPEERMSDDDRLLLKAQTAEAERDAEQAKLNRYELMRKAGQQVAGAAQVAQAVAAQPAQQSAQQSAQQQSPQQSPQQPPQHSVTEPPAAQSADAVAAPPAGEVAEKPLNEVEQAFDQLAEENGRATVRQISLLDTLRGALGMTVAQYNAALQRRGATTTESLSREQAEEMIQKMQGLREQQLKNSAGPTSSGS